MIVSVTLLSVTAPTRALDDAARAEGRAAVKRAIEFLRATQQPEGCWTPQPGPAVTALVAAGMLRSPTIDRKDPTVAKAIDYILAHQQDDGGIYNRILANYNTSIALMALGMIDDDPRIKRVVTRAQNFLRDLQWSDQTDPSGDPINTDHPWFGGAGYGRHGRPDLSNTQIMLEGLYDSGLECDDPAFIRALAFITRCQGAKSNTRYADRIAPDGGFVYATSEDKQSIGVPQSPAGKMTDEHGVSRLRTYGSMTYAGFKSYLYAKLKPKDPRVLDAIKWIRANYTLDKNPRMGMQGYYYYLHTFARAMHAWGKPTITTADGKIHDWRADLIVALAKRQNDNGSWVNPADRWMESDANLVTAYALLALQFALEETPKTRPGPSPTPDSTLTDGGPNIE
ncbi:MAG: hypothetical protein CMJ49_11805 [Planctomycetaceae bacterium]|nr:hypothetical protein [Planctomycetaceae bacterium]